MMTSLVGKDQYEFHLVLWIFYSCGLFSSLLARTTNPTTEIFNGWHPFEISGIPTTKTVSQIADSDIKLIIILSYRFPCLSVPISLPISLFLSLCLSFYLSLYLPLSVYLSISLSLSKSLSLSNSFSLSFSLSLFISLSLSP